MLYRTNAIIIRSMDYGEGNKIVTLLTEGGSKAGVIIRGAKKARSRHGSLAQPFTYGEFVFFRGGGGGLGTLNHGEIMESNHLLRERLELAAYASYAAELADRTLQDDEADPFLYAQLKACFEAMQQDKDPQIVSHLFEMKVLQRAGYDPQLNACISCESEEGPFAVSAGGGGVLCRRCMHRDPYAIRLSEGAMKVLRLFRSLDLRRLGNVTLKQETKTEVKKAMRRLLDTHIGLQLKSRSFLDQMDKYEL
ncbi:DNA repair protein RecO [Paenibacillus curdlanolyticus YK9]|uniref:DNA repair protein RecO n=1 Tax=Paenibacillus curdlanolyticus YK9 TaxID=717606 RepID=E0I3A9_9BACL|nr:DNA repair protein RecO [Paenibacillus curdlanolyticus]EFM12773.1 DNA repair protein RecO [Paenibacillus curdlanolyticus YK9]